MHCCVILSRLCLCGSAGEVVALRFLEELEVLRAPAILGEGAILADHVPQLKRRSVTYRWACADGPCYRPIDRSTESCRNQYRWALGSALTMAAYSGRVASACVAYAWCSVV